VKVARPFSIGLSPDSIQMVNLDDVHIETRDSSVEVRAHHLLAVAGHHALSRGEVLRREDRRGDDERDVRGVHVAGLEVGAALVADEDLVPGEVRILVDREAVAQRADLLGADGHRRADLTGAVDAVRRLVVHRGLEHRGDVRTDDDEVRRAAERLAVDLVRHVDDRLDEGLVPLANRAGERRARVERGGASDLGARRLVDELAGGARPEVVRSASLGEEVVEDLTIDLESDLLGEDLGELHLSVEAVVGVQVLRELRRPLGAQLAGGRGDRDRLDLDVDLGDGRRGSRPEVRLEHRHRQGRSISAVSAEGVGLGEGRGEERRRVASAGSRHVGAGDDGEDRGVRRAERDQRIGREDAAAERAELVETTDVEDARAALDRGGKSAEAGESSAGLREEGEGLDVGRVEARELARSRIDDEELEAAGRVERRAVLLDEGRELRVELEELRVRAGRESETGVCERGRTAVGATEEDREAAAVGRGVHLREGGANQVVLAAGGERSRADALAGGVVVDRLTGGVGRGARSGGATDVVAVGVIQVEEQAGGQAHRLDRHELVGHEAAEHATNDRERDVGEAAKVAGLRGAAAADADGVGLAEELGSLVLEEGRHVLTALAIEAAKETRAVPLLDEALVDCAKVALLDAL
jgi:hypothetical protein